MKERICYFDKPKITLKKLNDVKEDKNAKAAGDNLYTNWLYFSNKPKNLLTHEILDEIPDALLFFITPSPHHISSSHAWLEG
jgi:hypothetical protein